MVKRCLIVFSEKDVIVEFSGDWTRLDIDKAHTCMMRGLPKHLMDRKEEESNKAKQKELILNMEEN